MKKITSIKKLVVPAIMLITSVGLIMGCTSKESDADKAETDNMTASEQESMSDQQAMNDAQTFTATLEGSNEVPGVSTDATGMVTVTLKGDSVHVKGQFSGLSSEYTGSHIHKGAKGQNGNPVQSLDPEMGSDKMSGSWDSWYMLDKTQISALKADSLYVNVHSSDHKPGEIRGQLSSSGSGM